MNKFMMAQKKCIERDKWLEGCRIESDPGVEFIMNWIENNAVKFRESWEKSLCKNCHSSTDCGFELKQDCIKYIALAK